jgi:hypothetical protein
MFEDPYQEEFNCKNDALLKQLDPNVLGSFVSAFLIAGLITAQHQWGIAIFDTAIRVMNHLGEEKSDASLRVAADLLTSSAAFANQVTYQQVYNTLSTIIAIRNVKNESSNLPK